MKSVTKKNRTLTNTHTEHSGVGVWVLLVLSLSFLVFPVHVLAQTIDSIYDNFVREIINPIIIFLIGLALVVFLWGMVQYIFQSDSDEGRSKGRQHIMWGLIGLFITVSVFGIMNIICNTIGAC